MKDYFWPRSFKNLVTLIGIGIGIGSDLCSCRDLPFPGFVGSNSNFFQIFLDCTLDRSKVVLQGTSATALAIENEFTRTRARFTIGKKLCPLFYRFFS